MAREGSDDEKRMAGCRLGSGTISDRSGFALSRDFSWSFPLVGTGDSVGHTSGDWVTHSGSLEGLRTGGPPGYSIDFRHRGCDGEPDFGQPDVGEYLLVELSIRAGCRVASDMDFRTHCLCRDAAGVMDGGSKAVSV